MARANGQPDAALDAAFDAALDAADARKALLDALSAAASGYEFAQLVRQVETLWQPERSVGEGSNPQREAVRFRAAVDLAFPPSEVVGMELGDDGAAEVTVAFLSLAGAHGPLPTPLAERVTERLAEGDPAGRDFLDLFHHRLVSLAYRISRRMHPVLQGVPPERTETAEALWSLIGLGMPELRGRMKGVDDRALLARAGLLAGQPRSQAGLAGLLADHFGVPCDVEPLVGRWLQIPAEEWTRIGATGGQRTLGVDAALGRRVWDPQAAVRIRLGPLPLELYESFLPAGRTAAGPVEGTGLTQLRELVRFYAGVETSFVLTLVLDADQAPPMKLPRAGAADPPRLGWTSWLKTVALAADPEVGIDPERACGCGALA